VIPEQIKNYCTSTNAPLEMLVILDPLSKAARRIAPILDVRRGFSSHSWFTLTNLSSVFKLMPWDDGSSRIWRRTSRA